MKSINNFTQRKKTWSHWINNFHMNELKALKQIQVKTWRDLVGALTDIIKVKG